MLRVVTSNNTEIFRHLGARALQSIGVDHTVATNYRSAIELIRTKHPHLAIFDAELAQNNGYELCRAVKADPALSDVRFIMVLKAVVSREQLALLGECGCDDVLALPVRSDDFFHHIVQVAGLPFRRFERIDCSFEVEVEAPEQNPLIGQVDNVSLGGLGIRFEGDLPDGQLVTIRMRHGDNVYPDTRATVAWTRHIGKDNSIAGLAFAEMPVATRLFIEELCLFDVETSDDVPERALVTMHGDFVETTNFQRLLDRLVEFDVIEFNLREVHRISSIGVQLWTTFLEDLGEKQYYFRHASTTFTSQVSMIPTAAGTGQFLSFEAPYRCDTCDIDDVRLLEAAAVLREGDEVLPPILHCSICGGELAFDDLSWRYFSFLVRQRNW